MPGDGSVGAARGLDAYREVCVSFTEREALGGVPVHGLVLCRIVSGGTGIVSSTRHGTYVARVCGGDRG